LRLGCLPQWWHLLSLDAPTVAALWSWSIAAALHVRLPLSALLLLAMGTWLVYVADRILDGVLMASPATLRERHFFYARHRGTFLVATVPVGLLLLWLIVTRMNPAARREDIFVFGIALLYFCIVHVHGPAAERWLPKELSVGVVFAAATAVPAWSRLPASESFPGRTLLTIAVLFFAVLCWLNCAAIEKWEREHDIATLEAGSQAPHRTTLWAQRHFQELCLGISIAAALIAVWAWLIGETVRVPSLFLVCALTAAGFAALDRWQASERVSAFYLRVAADAVMLTPLLLISSHVLMRALPLQSLLAR
jgi:hypothetical protein